MGNRDMLDEKTHDARSCGRPLFIFCRVNALKMVSGGERYDARLRDISAEMPDISVEDFVLYEDSPSEDSDSGRKRSRIGKVFAPIAALRRVLKYRNGILDSSPEKRGVGLVWHFNSSKCIYFLPAMIALRAKRDECITVTHHPMYLQFGGLRRWLYRFFEMMFVKRADVCYTPSEYTLDVIKSQLPKREIELLPIPFDKDKIDSKNATERDARQLLYVGTLEPRKGLHKLVDALKTLKSRGEEFSLKVVGKTVDGGYVGKIKEEVEGTGLAVEFCGYVGEEELRELYERCGMLVHPSAAEGYGIVIVEALRVGLPVVAFRNTAIPYVLGDGERGMICKDGDVAALSDGILRMSRDEELRKRCAEAGRRYVASLPGGKEFRDEWRKILKKVLTPTINHKP